jgi:hypothetical protein
MKRRIPASVLAERKAEAERVRQAILIRSSGVCEVVKNGVRCKNPGSEFHHTRFRSKGGQDTEENQILICEQDHRIIHTQPKSKYPWVSNYIRRYIKRVIGYIEKEKSNAKNN